MKSLKICCSGIMKLPTAQEWTCCSPPQITQMQCRGLENLLASFRSRTLILILNRIICVCVCVSYSHFRGTALVKAFGWWMLSFGVHTQMARGVFECVCADKRHLLLLSFHSHLHTTNPPWSQPMRTVLVHTQDTLIPQLITNWFPVPLFCKHRQRPLLALVCNANSSVLTM